MVELHGTSMILLFDEQMQGKSRTLRAASVTIGSKIGPSKLEQLRLLFIYQEKNFKILTTFVVFRRKILWFGGHDKMVIGRNFWEGGVFQVRV